MAEAVVVVAGVVLLLLLGLSLSLSLSLVIWRRLVRGDFETSLEVVEAGLATTREVGRTTRLQHATRFASGALH